MKLTGFQRVTLGIAIIAGSLFVAGILYKHNQTKTGSTKPPPVADTQEAVILKSLFLNDFGPQLNRARDETSLTIGCKTNKFPEMTLPFTASAVSRLSRRYAVPRVLYTSPRQRPGRGL